MSSESARASILAAVTAAAAPLPVEDVSDFVTLVDALPTNSSEVVLVQYAVSDERVATIGGEGNQSWEEDGTVVLHLVIPSGNTSAAAVAKGEAIRQALRGTRHGKVTIEACSPFTDYSNGASGLYGGAWKGWASNLYYVSRDCGQE